MKKSLYSLILMDKVVSEIDKLAAEQRTNRSNLINQILAEYVSLTTPEKKIASIFESIESLLDNNIFSSFFAPNERTLSVKSSLEYKYRPTIKYDVELYRNDDKTVGALKVTFRTQSATLLMELTGFFQLWIQLENVYLAEYYPANSLQYSLEEGKFSRSFSVPLGKEYSTEQIANAIGSYISMLDAILKSFLSHELNTTTDIERKYLSYLSSGIEII